MNKFLESLCSLAYTWTDRRIDKTNTIIYKVKKKAVKHYKHERNSFLARIITVDETRLHHFEHEIKKQSLVWKYLSSLTTKKLKTHSFAGKLKMTIFWDMEGPLLVYLIPKSETVNNVSSCELLQELKKKNQVQMTW